MRKKDKLYTVNRYNRPAFMPKENIYAGGSWLGISKEDNPFSKQNLKGAFGKEALGNAAKAGVGAAISGVAGAIGSMAGNAISGGLESGAGSTISGIGSTVGSAVGTVNPVLGAAIGVGSQVLGGVTNALFGEKVDAAKLKAANESMSSLRSFNGNVGSFDEIKGPEATASVAGTYQGGLFNSNAKKKQKALEEAMRDARQYASRSMTNNIGNLADDQMNNALANYSAFGGPIDTYDMGALEYGLMTDFLNTKRKKVEDSNKETNLFAGMPSTMFDLGGDIQTHGSGYSVGKVYDVSEKEANRLKALGYEFTVVS